MVGLQDNFAISQQTNFINNQLLFKNMFRIKKTEHSYLQIKRFEHQTFYKL